MLIDFSNLVPYSVGFTVSIETPIRTQSTMFHFPVHDSLNYQILPSNMLKAKSIIRPLNFHINLPPKLTTFRYWPLLPAAPEDPFLRQECTTRTRWCRLRPTLGGKANSSEVHLAWRSFEEFIAFDVVFVICLTPRLLLEFIDPAERSIGSENWKRSI